ncbi:MAG: metallophosphoesterase [Ruminococcus sp.]|nr:metallophosphoesterase [Ruminococcus sp.]
MKDNSMIRSYNLKKEGLAKKGKFTAVFLTDLHIRKEDASLEKIEKKIESLHPDLVLVGGDVVVAKPGQNTEYAIAFMKRISEKYNVVYANGNHEQRMTECTDVYGTMGADYDRAIADVKVTRLINQRLDLEIRGIPITIYGHQPDRRFFDKGKFPHGMEDDLQDRFQKPDEKRFTILLSHNPRYEKEYLSWGADLTLSGHYHGGVVLLNSRRGLITPDFRLFSSQCCGIREANGKKMIISAGVGEHTVPIRVHNPKEITYISVECS